jgi:hypothetical protein
MGVITTRYRSLWTLALALPLLAGVVAFFVEASVATGRPCTKSDASGVLFDVVFIAIALVPALLVAGVGWRSRREGADTVGPFILTTCLSVFLVFIGLAAAWGGSGCMT